MSGRYFIPKDYSFEQSTPAQVWSVPHTCGKPHVDVFILNETSGFYEKMIPYEVVYISDVLCEIHFTQPFAGKAVIAG